MIMKSRATASRDQEPISSISSGFSIVGLMLLIPFFFLPVLTIAAEGFKDGQGSFSFETLRAVITDSYTWRITAFTTLQALVSTLVSGIIALPGAYLIARRDFFAKPLIRAVTLIPFVLPSILVVLGFVIFYGNSGVLNRILSGLPGQGMHPLRILYSFKAIILAHSFYNVPIFIAIVGSFWEQLPNDLEQASWTMGAHQPRTFINITLPRIFPAILAAASLVFVYCFTSFAIILVLGGGPRFTTLEVEIYRQARVALDVRQASGLALFSTLITGAFVYLSLRAQRAITLRGGAPGALMAMTYRGALNSDGHLEGSPTLAGTWGRRFTSIITLSYSLLMLLFIIGPLAAVVIRSFQAPVTRSADPVMTLRWYKEILGLADGQLTQAGTAIGNSLLLGIGSVLLSAIMAIGLAQTVTRLKGKDGALLETVFMLPATISSIVIGLGYFILGTLISGDHWRYPLIMCAHTVLAFPFMFRAILPTVRQISQSYSPAAYTLGGTPNRVFLTIQLPLLKSSLLSGAAFAFAISLGEMNATLILSQSRIMTIPILMFRLIGSYNFFGACALGSILIAFSLAVFMIFESNRRTRL